MPISQAKLLLFQSTGPQIQGTRSEEMSSSDNQQIMVLTQEKVAHSALFRS